jgi:hypothetical protein
VRGGASRSACTGYLIARVCLDVAAVKESLTAASGDSWARSMYAMLQPRALLFWNPGSRIRGTPLLLARYIKGSLSENATCANITQW